MVGKECGVGMKAVDESKFDTIVYFKKKKIKIGRIGAKLTEAETLEDHVEVQGQNWK
jgi:hypothetical protein